MGFDLGRAPGWVSRPVMVSGRKGEATYGINADVIVGGSLAVPAKILFRLVSRGRPTLTMGIELRHDEPVCTYLELEADPASAVKGERLKEIRVEDWVTQIVAECSKTVTMTKDQRPGRRSYRLDHGPATPDQVKAVERMQRRRRDPRSDTEFLKRVAAIYLANPEAPNRAVAAEFDVTPRTASRWAEYASEAELLPRAKQGQRRI